MEHKRKINLENLKNELGNQIPTVHEDYFAQLEKNILLKTSETKLNQLKEKNPFVVPDTYFEKLEINLNAITEPAAKIEKLVSKHNIFTVPENYFNNLASEIQQKVRKEDSKTFNLADFVLKPVPQFALAACLLIIIGLVFLLPNQNKQNSASQDQLSQISKLDAANYLAENVSNNEEIVIEEIAANKNIKINMLSKKVAKEINTENLDLELNEADIEDITTENL